MIIHKLIAQHLRHKDDPDFYAMQAEDAIRWIEKAGVPVGNGVRALDLGCGHGIFGAQLGKRGCSVTFADQTNYLLPELANADFKQFDLEKQDLSELGRYDLVICSNVLEHISSPQKLIRAIPSCLTPLGAFYLSWTNWLSPWGGHEFSPFHYLGPRRGHLLYDRLLRKKRVHTPYENLFPTSIHQILREIKNTADLRTIAIAPRYYPEFSFLVAAPILREFLTWNLAVLMTRKAS